jgi:hypothetical protein
MITAFVIFTDNVEISPAARRRVQRAGQPVEGQVEAALQGL